MRQLILTITTLTLGTAALAAPLAISPELSRSARQKIERIENGRTAPGEAIVFTEAEINSLLEYEYKPEMPAGVREPTVRIEQDYATIHAFVDIGKMQQVAGGSWGGLWALLFSGERELNAQCGPRALDGRAAIEVESVEFGGATLPVTLVNWLISTTVSDAETGSGNPVALPESIRAVRFEPEQAVVVMN